MRIAAGALKGLTIRAPRQIRPTEGLVRQALFNILGQVVAGARVLDAFAGSGALGLEALSRGADAVTWIESDPEAQRALQQTLERLPADLAARGRLLRGDALRLIPALSDEGRQYDLILLDPPYSQEVAKKALRLVGGCVILARSGIVCVEHAHGTAMPTTEGPLAMTTQHRYGHTVLSFYHAIQAAA
jgi:16S rRNA (guanine(966)-N(2))-methyltransferase RsmD